MDVKVTFVSIWLLILSFDLPQSAVGQATNATLTANNGNQTTGNTTVTTTSDAPSVTEKPSDDSTAEEDEKSGLHGLPEVKVDDDVKDDGDASTVDSESSLSAEGSVGVNRLFDGLAADRKAGIESLLSAAEFDGAQESISQPVPDDAGSNLDLLQSVQSPVDFAALKADRDLMKSLEDYLGRFGIKLPASLIHQVDKTDLCAENAVGGLKYYCLKMENGQYYDPWNPWCGYIECQNGNANRKFCQSLTWMGMGRTDNTLMMNKDDMCRRLLQKTIVDGRCAETTDFDMCERTRTLETNSSSSGTIIPGSVQAIVNTIGRVVQR